MQRFRPFHPIARRLGTIGLISAILVLASGCTTKAPSHAHGQTETFGSSADKSASELIPVVRYGRYTLVELVPEAAQQDLLASRSEADKLRAAALAAQQRIDAVLVRLPGAPQE